MSCRPQRDSFLVGRERRAPASGRVPGKEMEGGDDGGGGCGKNGRVTPCLQGEPPSGSWEKGTEYVCSVVSGQGRSGDGPKSDLHTGSATSGLRKSGRGIRWRTLEGRQTANPSGLSALTISLPQPPS